MNRHRVEGAARNLAGQLEEETAKATDSPRLYADGLYLRATGAAQEGYGQALDSLRDVTDRAGRYAEEVYGEGRRTVERGSRALNAQVEANPIMAIALAGFVGYLLGMATEFGRKR